MSPSMGKQPPISSHPFNASFHQKERGCLTKDSLSTVGIDAIILSPVAVRMESMQ